MSSQDFMKTTLPKGVGAARPRRVAVVNSHPIQYFAPLYSFLSADPDIEIEVLYLSDSSLRGTVDPGFGRSVKWDVDLLAGYSSRFVGKNSRNAVPGGFFSLIAPELFSEILRGDYDAVLVHGYAYAANLIAIATAKSAGIPVWMRLETHQGLAKHKEQRFLSLWIKKMLFRFCHRALAIGQLNRDYYISMGVPPERIVLVPYSVDNGRFAMAAEMSVERRSAVRDRYGIRRNSPAFLFVSKLMERKNPHHVVQAAGQLSKEGIDFDLVMAGTGEMEDGLRRMAEELPSLNIIFPGFINQREMPELLGATDALVFPTTEEPWGLIVNEAMAAGRPIVVGRNAGCVPDLVQHGANGFAVDPDDIDALMNAMRILAVDREIRDGMSRSSREIIARWSYRECLAGWREALGLPVVPSVL